MSISLACPHCHEVLQLADQMAGREGACLHCGGTFCVPMTSDPGAELLLCKAGVEQIVAELARRGSHAVLTLLTPSGDQSTAPRDPLRAALQPDSSLRVSIRHLSTSGLSVEECRALLTILSQVKAAPKPPLPAAAPTLAAGNQPTPAATTPAAPATPLAPPSVDGVNFSFKSDPLGMKLSDFRLKHERVAPGRRRRMPWCSDESPKEAIPALMYEAVQASLGLIHARIDLPGENLSPTIGGASTEAVIYQFLDERLFQITGFFSTDDFTKVSQALRTKYGEPQSEEEKPFRLQWWRGDSTIEITQGRVHPREHSVFRCFHDDLLDEARHRKPDTASDL